MRAWKEETVYHAGDQFFPALLRAIAHARTRIELETYIFDRDHLGQELISALAAAAGRGVRVRLLLDGFGCSQWTYADLERLRGSGIQVRVFHPLPWQRGTFSLARYLTFRRTLLGLWKLNRRNHRKTCIIDGEVAFLGGMNVTSRHLSTASGGQAWRDTSVRVAGGVGVARLVEAFDRTWSHPASLLGRSRRRRRRRRATARSSAIRLNQNLSERKGAYENLLHRIQNAKRRVWITNPYFIPDMSLIGALRLAAGAGVDVRLLFPRDNDIRGLKWAAQAFYLPLLSAGARIFEYRPSPLHAKLVLIDDWATVGSSNLNHRSLLHDLEVDVVLAQAESIRSLEEQFHRDLSLSDEIEHSHWRRRSWVRSMPQKAALIFQRWL